VIYFSSTTVEPAFLNHLQIMYEMGIFKRIVRDAVQVSLTCRDFHSDMEMRDEDSAGKGGVGDGDDAAVYAGGSRTAICIFRASEPPRGGGQCPPIQADR